MVVVVLLNVLIALASDSYEKCLVRSQHLFGRARVMLIAELVSFQNLLRRHGEEEVATYGVYSVWCWSDSWANGWSRGKSKTTVHTLCTIRHWSGRCVMSKSHSLPPSKPACKKVPLFFSCFQPW